MSLQVIFSQTSENLERQSSMASSTEEVSGTNDVSTDSKQHDTTDTEQKFGMYMREFDFLEYELESLEVQLLFSYYKREGRLAYWIKFVIRLQWTSENQTSK